MNLSPALEKEYTVDRMSARKAQRLAEYIAFGPVIFEASRLMVKYGILDMLRDSAEGLTIDEVASQASISRYAAKVLLEASLSIGTVIVNKDTDRFSITKVGWFLLTDAATRVNMDFNHDVNYMGWFELDEALKTGRPAGLRHLGDWPTIYEGLSSLPEDVQKSWFGFDHFYSDNSFDEALALVFALHPRNILDVGGNTGRWACRCGGHYCRPSTADRADERSHCGPGRSGAYTWLRHGPAGCFGGVPGTPPLGRRMDEPVS